MSERQPYSTEFHDIIDDLNLSPHAFRLYMHVKRVHDETGQGCHETTSELAHICNMSTGMVSEAKRELLDAQLFIIGKGKRGRNEVDIITPLEVPSPQAGRYLDPGYIYVIKAATGQYKIGLSTDPTRRFLSLNTASPVELTLLHTFPANHAKIAEEVLHSDFASKRVKGEWFALDEDDVAWLCSVEGYDDGVFHANY